MSAPVSFIECVSKMAYTRVLSCVMLALISSIIASIQLNLAIIDIQENYKRRKKNRIYCILKFTSLKHRRKWWCASETIIMINFHHPLLSLLSFKEIDDQNLKK